MLSETANLITATSGTDAKLAESRGSELQIINLGTEAGNNSARDGGD